MRVVYYSSITPKYHEIRGPLFIAKSLGAMKNLIQQSDRPSEMALMIKGGEDEQDKGQW